MSSFRAALTEVTPRLRERRRKAAWAVVRRVFAALDRVRPHLAAQLAVEIFLTPPRRVHICRCHGSRAAQGHVESEQHQSSWPFEASSVVEVPFRGRMLVGQRVGSGPAVLLVHGWGSTYCQFHALARALVAGGFSVVAFDAPAHGNTAERQADALAFAAAIATAFRKLGPFHAVVAHSFGCIGLAVAMDRYHVRPQRVVLMSAPSSLVWITEDFGA